MARAETLPTSPLSSPPDQPRAPWRPGPLAGRYPAAAAMVILFLVPYLGLSAALQPLAPIIARAVAHEPADDQPWPRAWPTAAYALGTVLAVQLPSICRSGGCCWSTAACWYRLGAGGRGDRAGMFIVGHVLQGLCTSLLLIAAAPPLFLGFPAAKLRSTAVIFNLCIFGAVAAGPLVGGAQASFHAWRPLFWIVAGIAFAGAG